MKRKYTIKTVFRRLDDVDITFPKLSKEEEAALVKQICDDLNKAIDSRLRKAESMKKGSAR